MLPHKKPKEGNDFIFKKLGLHGRAVGSAVTLQ